MSNILMTMAEEREATREDHFAVKYKVDEYDCFDFAGALRALGHDVFFANWDDLAGREFNRMFHDNRKRFVAPVPISRVDLIFVYKMEGFYFDLQRFFAMVQTFADACPIVLNHPLTIRHNIDKRYLWDLGAKGVRVIPTHNVDAAVRRRLAGGEPFVLKPIRGERGQGVILLRTIDELSVIRGREDEYLAQDYMPAIRGGERSLVFLGLEYQHAVLKRPSASNPQEFRCNESLGGTVEVYEPTGEEKDFSLGVLKAYESLGCPVNYSRVDLIQTEDGPMLMEAELINPSIFANYSGKGAEFGRSIARYFDQLLTKDKVTSAEKESGDVTRSQ
jgi:glutathione synthase/RimK-type ligase-like ATP-grasp enzyme